MDLDHRFLLGFVEVVGYRKNHLAENTFACLLTCSNLGSDVI